MYFCINKARNPISFPPVGGNFRLSRTKGVTNKTPMKKQKNTGIYGIKANSRIASPGNDLSKIVKGKKPKKYKAGAALSRPVK